MIDTPPPIPNLWFPDISLFDTHHHVTRFSSILLPTTSNVVYKLEDVLLEKEIHAFLHQMHKHPHNAVNTLGMPTSTEISAWRYPAWSRALAQLLWNRTHHFFETIREMTNKTSTDWYGTPERTEHRRWNLHEMSPFFRCIEYMHGGEHWPHYDMGYDYPDTRRSLLSFVIYLNSVSSSDQGAMRFIRDGQEHLPVWQRNHTDWNCPSKEETVLLKIQPTMGTMVVFDHRVLHDVEMYTGGDTRISMRGDIVYRAI